MDSSIIQALNKLFIQQLDADVTFFVKEQDVKAHKLILNLRSEALKTVINNKLSYENGKIVINDPEVGVEDFKEFLKYLYTDDCKIGTENVKVLLHLSHMYLVPSLLEKCSTFIQNDYQRPGGSKPYNVFDYAEMGLLYENDCSLMEKCLKYISEKNLLVFEYRLSRAKVSPKLVLKIVKDYPRTNSCTEDHLFKAVINWAVWYQDCEKKSTSLKDIMKDMIPFIKFHQLKPITLAITVAKQNLLPEKDAFKALCKSVVRESKSPSGQSVTSPANSPWNGVYYANSTGSPRYYTCSFGQINSSFK